MTSSLPLSLVLVLVLLVSENVAAAPHVCIIGAGIAGASTSHFLSTCSPQPRITVFEKADKPGGRIASLSLQHTPPIEAGASIIAADNALMAYFVHLLNLTRTIDLDESDTLGFWDGTAFSYRLGSSSLRNLISLLTRYHISLLRMRLLVRRLLNAFSNVYPAGGPGALWKGHATAEQIFARAPSLYNYTQQSFSELAEKHFSPRFLHEMVAAIERVNYGQEVAAMNGLSGFIGLAGSGGGLWQVQGGNDQVVSGLLSKSNAEVILKTSISRIAKKGSTYVVSSDQKMWTCDAVVLAVPFELAGIELPPKFADKLDVGRKFQRTVATFVRGSLNTKTFGSDPPDTILTTSYVNDVMTSVAKNSHHGNVSIFKVFSKDTLNKSAMVRLFHPGAETVAVYPWYAYPKFSIPEKFAPMSVDEDGAFMYTSPLESAGSAMEMSAISGANAAALVRQRLLLEPREAESTVKDDL